MIYDMGLKGRDSQSRLVNGFISEVTPTYLIDRYGWFWGFLSKNYSRQIWIFGTSEYFLVPYTRDRSWFETALHYKPQLIWYFTLFFHFLIDLKSALYFPPFRRKKTKSSMNVCSVHNEKLRLDCMSSFFVAKKESWNIDRSAL